MIGLFLLFTLLPSSLVNGEDLSDLDLHTSNSSEPFPKNLGDLDLHTSNSSEPFPRDLVPITIDVGNATEEDIQDRQGCTTLGCFRIVNLGPGNAYIFSSPNFPGAYGPNAGRCNRMFNVRPNTRVTMTCSNFNTQCSDPFNIQINFRTVFSACGTRLDGGRTRLRFSVSQSVFSIRVTFTHQSGSTAPGFRCTISGVGENPATPAPTPPPSQTCDCGTTFVNDRIVGGGFATVNEYPWMVALTIRPANSFNTICGGILVDRCHVLTAAHCMGRPASSYQVILGDHRMFVSDQTERIFDISRIIIHPTYNNPRFNNDFAILRLRTCVSSFNRAIRPACLPRDNTDQYVGRLATVSGWGRVIEDGSQSNTLKETNLNVVSNSACSRVYGGTLTPNMICAYRLRTGSCQGDSGGPLTTLVGGRHTVIGVVSFGIGCARPNIPGVYARVSTALGFLRSNGVNPCRP